MSATAVKMLKPMRKSHPVLVVRSFMYSALSRRAGVVPVSPAWSGAELSSSAVIGSPPFPR